MNHVEKFLDKEDYQGVFKVSLGVLYRLNARTELLNVLVSLQSFLLWAIGRNVNDIWHICFLRK